MSIDRFLRLLAGMQLEEFWRHPQHGAAGGEREAGTRLQIVKLDRDLAAPRDGGVRHKYKVELELDLVFRQQGASSRPRQFRLLVLEEGDCHRLGVTGVDQHSG